jgi:hypothetical protein
LILWQKSWQKRVPKFCYAYQNNDTHSRKMLTAETPEILGVQRKTLQSVRLQGFLSGAEGEI